MKRNIFFIILTLSLVACSSNKVDKESEQNKAEVISNLGESERSDLDKLATHKESGVYHYKTFNTKDNSVILKKFMELVILMNLELIVMVFMSSEIEIPLL